MITVLIERHIVPGMASTYANYATQIIQASVSAPGFISGESLKGIDDSNARYIVIKIRSIQDWKNWFTSPEREKITSLLSPILALPEKVTLLTH